MNLVLVLVFVKGFTYSVEVEAQCAPDVDVKEIQAPVASKYMY